MSNRLQWLAILGLTLLAVYQGSTAYTPPAPKPPQEFLTAPAGVWNKPDGTKAAVLMLFYADGTTGWSAQPIEATNAPVLKLK